jgi:hypothetical protein
MTIEELEQNRAVLIDAFLPDDKDYTRKTVQDLVCHECQDLIGATKVRRRCDVPPQGVPQLHF